MDFKNLLSGNSDALVQLGAGLLGGRTANEQLAGGLTGFAQGRKQNKTLDWLRQRDPEIAAAMESGLLDGSGAAQAYFQKQRDALKSEKPQNPYMSAGGSVLNWQTGEWMTPPAGPGDAPKNPYEDRQAAAEGFGLNPDDPAYKSFVLTGKMPREDAQPLSAGDKRAILDADEQVQTNQNAIVALEKAKQINTQANSGWGAGTRATLGNNLPDWMVPDSVSSPQSSAATVDYDNVVIGTALSQLKSIFGGNPTEGERQILLDLQGSSSLPPETRAKILDRAQEAAQRRLDFNKQRAAALRGGEYYKPQGAAAPAGQPAGQGRTNSGISFTVEP